ncbi:MAG: penicillin-binding protein 2, partial [Candidatus Omnitrophota bacterium]
MKTHGRDRFIYLLFVFFFLAISAKIFYLQICRQDFFGQLAQNQHYRFLKLEGRRGAILDRRGRNLASGIQYYSIFADPALIVNAGQTARLLAAKLDVPVQELRERLTRKKRFVWLKRKISWELKQEIKSLDLAGVGFLREEKRFYPQGILASQSLGIVNIDNQGLDGLELYYNDFLSGKDGSVKMLQDSTSRNVMISSQVIAPQPGADLHLTLDAQIQYWCETFLAETVVKFKAKGGSVVVMEASSGDILALANYPAYDPNDPRTFSSDSMRNAAVCDMFEPGSVFKIVTLLGAIAENKFSDDDRIDCENGSWSIPGSTLHDYHPYSILSFKEVFMKSSNIGVAKIAQKLGPSAMYDYITRLGFGRRAGIDLPGEISGNVKAISRWSKTSSYIMPIGQEVGVNLLQLARAVGAIANGGYLVEPHMVKNICSRGFCKSIPTKKERILPQAVAERAK